MNLQEHPLKTQLIFLGAIVIIFSFSLACLMVFLEGAGFFEELRNFNTQRGRQINHLLSQHSQETRERIKTRIKTNLFQKGKSLIEKDSLIVKSFFEENSITSIREFLKKSYSLDSEITYASFFLIEGEEINAWQIVTKEYPKGIGWGAKYSPQKQGWKIKDSKNKSFFFYDPYIKEIINKNKPIFSLRSNVQSSNQNFPPFFIDCVLPITTNHEYSNSTEPSPGPKAFLRYHLTLKLRHQEMDFEDKHSKRAQIKYDIENRERERIIASMIKRSMQKSLFSLTLACFIIIVFAFLLFNFFTEKIMDPIRELARFADSIAKGNYNEKLKINRKDEIGNLSRDFEVMRQKVKIFTDHLQELVQDKTKEIEEIFNTIDQGIFTIDNDLLALPEHSIKAKKIFSTSIFEGKSIREIFHLSDDDYFNFKDWHKMISHPQRLKKWEKYSLLCPVQEIEIQDSNEVRYIQLEYQPIIKNENLDKLMILSQDKTHEKKSLLQFEQQAKEQEKERERIVSLVKNDRETVFLFLENARFWINNLINQIQNKTFLPQVEYDNIFRELHSLKGNAGSLGFYYLCLLAGKSELSLDQNKTNDNQHSQSDLLQSIINLDNELKAIEKIRVLIYGTSKEQILLHGPTYNKLVQSLKSIETPVQEEIKKLNTISLSHASTKYQNLCNLYRLQTAKRISDLTINGGHLLIHRSKIPQLDTVCSHLVRNSIAHGIESPLMREYAGKGPGKIEISMELKGDHLSIIFEDDGQGLDSNQIFQVALEMKILDIDKSLGLTNAEKLQLIFKKGFSTTPGPNDLSGHGFGLYAVHEIISHEKGEITVESDKGLGTRFIIQLPWADYIFLP